MITSVTTRRFFHAVYALLGLFLASLLSGLCGFVIHIRNYDARCIGVSRSRECVLVFADAD